MRAGSRVDDGMSSLDFQLRAVVPPAAEIGAVEVVRRVGDPLGHETRVVLVEVDRDHLPVGFVIVHPVEPRPPRVVGEEEPVLADRPAALPDDTPLVDEPRVILPDLRIFHRGRSRSRPRHVATEQERQREEPVPEPRQKATARQPTHTRVELVLLLPGELTRLRERRRALLEIEGMDEAEIEQGSESGVSRLDQRVERQLTLGDCLFVGSVRHVEPEAAFPQVGLDRHRVERLTLRVADDRLEGANDLEVR